MRVCLLSPYSGERNYEICDISLGIAYLSSVLSQNNIENYIVDTRASRMNIKETVKSTLDLSPDVLGISCTTNQFLDGLEIAKQLKNLNPRMNVIFGGAHVSALPEETIRYNAVDYVICGEGEYSFLNLVKHLSGKENLKEGGIYFKRDGQVYNTGLPKRIEGLDALPYPNFSKFNIAAYFNRQRLFAHTKSAPYLPIMTSRGCSGRCTFCCKSVHKGRYYGRNPESLIGEIERDVREYGVREIRIYDDNFTLLRHRVIEFCKLAVSKNLHLNFALPNGIRVDQVDEEMLRWMYKAGFYMIFFGIESGDQKVLDTIKKGIDIEKTKYIINLCKRIGFYTCVYLVVGLPGSSGESEKHSLQLLQEVKPYFIGVSITTPYPGSELYSSIKKKNINWEVYKHDFTKRGTDLLFIPEEMSKEEIIKWYNKLYRNFYTSPSFLINQLRFCNIFWLPKRLFFFLSSFFRRFIKRF